MGKGHRTAAAMLGAAATAHQQEPVRRTSSTDGPSAGRPRRASR